jgi:hypothetical protein
LYNFFKESEFFAIGQLVATAVLQTSTRFPVFNHVMFEYLSGKTVADLSPKIGDVTDVNVTAFLLKVSAVHNNMYCSHA